MGNQRTSETQIAMHALFRNTHTGIVLRTIERHGGFITLGGDPLTLSAGFIWHGTISQFHLEWYPHCQPAIVQERRCA